VQKTTLFKTGNLHCPSFYVKQSKNIGIILLLIITILFTGCSYNSKQIMFKPPHKIKMNGASIMRYNVPVDTLQVEYMHRIQPDNRVFILQQNKDIVEVLSVLSRTEGYLVDQEGNIRLPIVGKVYVAGLTRNEASKLLEKVFSVYYKDPVFQVEILNMFVQVLGNSGTNTGGMSVQLDKEKTHLVEVLGKAGGIPSFSRIKYVRIVRGDPKDPQLIIVDITQLKSLAEDDLIMHNGDIVYLEPKNIKLLADAITPYIGLFALVNVITTIFLLTRNFRSN
jgi:polysaccharide biosynthesis/export protein